MRTLCVGRYSIEFICCTILNVLLLLLFFCEKKRDQNHSVSINPNDPGKLL